jgi:steroid delta-isomerase-like uncharacterized protein
MTSTEENKDIVRRAIDTVGNEGKTEIAAEFFTEDYVRHDAGIPEVPRGPEGFVQASGMFREAFPDAVIRIDEMVAEGDLVTFRAVESGTHEGPFMGLEPTGKRVEFSGNAMHRVADGKIAETWATWDMLGLLRQLGVEPKPPEKPAP